MITKLLQANDAADLLMEHGMSEGDSMEALDWADENGEYTERRFSVVCMGGKTAGSIAYQITIR